jgi:hypothetical protein
LKGAVTWSHSSGIYLGYYLANNLFPGGSADGDNYLASTIMSGLTTTILSG